MDVFTLIGFFVCLSCLIVLAGVGLLLLLWRRNVIVAGWRRPTPDFIDAEYTIQDPPEEDASPRV